MQLECPKCGSDDVRLSRRRPALGGLAGLIGLYPFRCESCTHLFQSNLYNPRHLLYAKCPSCHRMDLGRWSRDYYSPPFWTRLMLNLGAKATRCEYCRNNFWSFRMVRERFSREKRAARSPVKVTSDTYHVFPDVSAVDDSREAVIPGRQPE